MSSLPKGFFDTAPDATSASLSGREHVIQGFFDKPVEEPPAKRPKVYQEQEEEMMEEGKGAEEEEEEEEQIGEAEALDKMLDEAEPVEVWDQAQVPHPPCAHLPPEPLPHLKELKCVRGAAEARGGVADSQDGDQPRDADKAPGRACPLPRQRGPCPTLSALPLPACPPPSVAISIPTDQEVTQGQIFSHSPTDATSSRWHLYGS